jgi:hypothetical protein
VRYPGYRLLPIGVAITRWGFVPDLNGDPPKACCSQQGIRRAEGAERAEEGGATAALDTSQPFTVSEGDRLHHLFHRQSATSFLNR